MPKPVAGVEGDDDDQQEVVAAVHRLGHQVRDRIDLGAEQLVAEHEAAGEVEQSEREHHEKRDAGQHAAGIECGELPVLRQARRRTGTQFDRRQ